MWDRREVEVHPTTILFGIEQRNDLRTAKYLWPFLCLFKVVTADGPSLVNASHHSPGQQNTDSDGLTHVLQIHPMTSKLLWPTNINLFNC
jgi:hypothetical protein